MTITYTTIATPLGWLLIAAGERGLRAVSFGRSVAWLEAELGRLEPAAIRRRDDAGLAAWAGQIQRHLAGEAPELELPVEAPATPLQARVWGALRAIPYGKTRAYGEIARELEPATTAKEVGAACAANPVALVIPCHRVVRADGSLAGYRWGVDRKRRLLELEASKTSPAASSAGDYAAGSPARQARMAAVCSG